MTAVSLKNLTPAWVTTHRSRVLELPADLQAAGQTGESSSPAVITAYITLGVEPCEFSKSGCFLRFPS